MLRRDGMAKRLVLCFDGTWNTPDQKEGPTNVYKMSKAVAPVDPAGVEQMNFYGEGVGTRWYDRILGGAFGWGLSEKIKDGYRWLIDNFDQGDELFLFGFSRGAYTARSTAGFIRKCGILRREHSDQLEPAYELYRQRDKDVDAPHVVRFRDSFSQTTNIRFLGVWDTVGSLGIPVGIPWMPMTFRHFIDKRWEFHDVRLSRTVENAFHAVAIDERRPQFRPTLWSQNPDHGNQVMEQVWFAGVHSNVGGGYNDTGLSDVTFMWMKGKAEQCGLHFNATWLANNIPSPNPLGVLRDSRELFYAWIPGRDRTIDIELEHRNAISDKARVRYVQARDPEYKPRPLLRYLRRIGEVWR
jgi:uncharacterized protein (DUF2235 family)